jgi:hypothetical protein
VRAISSRARNLGRVRGRAEEQILQLEQQPGVSPVATPGEASVVLCHRRRSSGLSWRIGPCGLQVTGCDSGSDLPTCLAPCCTRLCVVGNTAVQILSAIFWPRDCRARARPPSPDRVALAGNSSGLTTAGPEAAQRGDYRPADYRPW